MRDKRISTSSLCNFFEHHDDLPKFTPHRHMRGEDDLYLTKISYSCFYTYTILSNHIKLEHIPYTITQNTTDILLEDMNDKNNIITSSNDTYNHFVLKPSARPYYIYPMLEHFMTYYEI